jgi:glycosyltransferase involved in cell wall biosynthesis
MPHLTFIIPTIGRQTLEKTLESVENIVQPVKDWTCDSLVIFDGLEPTVKNSIRIEKSGERNHAGRVRNEGIKHTSEDSDWIGFVDDDDILHAGYLKALSECPTDDVDVVIFRMVYANNGLVLPPPGEKDFRICEVGISFCVKRKCFLDDGIWFEQCEVEDFRLLDTLRKKGKKIHMSDSVVYMVRPWE